MKLSIRLRPFLASWRKQMARRDRIAICALTAFATESRGASQRASSRKARRRKCQQCSNRVAGEPYGDLPTRKLRLDPKVSPSTSFC